MTTTGKIVLAIAMTSMAHQAHAAVNETQQQNVLCYVKKHAPDRVYGDLPFSCKGKPEAFVMTVKEWVGVMSEGNMQPNDVLCAKQIFEPQYMLEVAQTVWEVRDSPILSTPASTAFAVDRVCRMISAANSSDKTAKPASPTDEASRKATEEGYLPWKLTAQGYGTGGCEVTPLARSFREARGWAAEFIPPRNIHSIIESNEKLTIAYYDGLIKAESIRTFYRDMETCLND